MTRPVLRLDGPPSPALITVAGSAVAFGLAILAANADLADNRSLGSSALDVLVGLAFISGAAVAPGQWRARALFGAIGFAWLVGSLLPEAQLVYIGVLATALVTFPGGHPSSPWRWSLVALSLLAGVVGPANAELAGLFAAVAATTVLGKRWERAAWAFPAAAASALACLLLANFVAEHQLGAGFDEAMWLLAQEGLLVVIAAGFPVAARAVVQERATLADRLLADERQAGLDGLAEVLAATLGEAQLRIFRWDRGAESYMDREGRAAVLHNGASVIAVNDGDERLAAVAHHRPASIQDPVVERAVAEAVRLAALSERWQAALEAQLAELEAARGRLLAVTDRQRAVIAARLRDEVVRPIESAVAIINAIDTRTAGPETNTGGADAIESRGALKIAGEELATSIDDILDLTAGLPPAGLGEGGLAAALRRVAERSPVPVALTLAPDAAADPDGETALFYVCSEAVANSIKHAGSAHIAIDLQRDGDMLQLRVGDDGRGGADPTGWGIRGLADRLDACGGRLRVDSPPAAGTTVTARVPVRGR